MVQEGFPGVQVLKLSDEWEEAGQLPLYQPYRRIEPLIALSSNGIFIALGAWNDHVYRTSDPVGTRLLKKDADKWVQYGDEITFSNSGIFRPLEIDKISDRDMGSDEYLLENRPNLG